MTRRLMLATLSAVLFSACAYHRIEFPNNARLAADVIIVPGLALSEEGHAKGLLYNRIAMAKALMTRGLAPLLLVSGGKPKNGITEAERMVQIATELGVPRGRILIENAASSSVENGVFSARIMRKRRLRSAIVVSDYVHLMYALPVFRDAFARHNLKLDSFTVSYDQLKKRGTFYGYLNVVAPKQGETMLALQGRQRASTRAQVAVVVSTHGR